MSVTCSARTGPGLCTLAPPRLNPPAPHPSTNLQRRSEPETRSYGPCGARRGGGDRVAPSDSPSGNSGPRADVVVRGACTNCGPRANAVVRGARTNCGSRADVGVRGPRGSRARPVSDGR